MVIKLPKPPSVNSIYGTTSRGGYVHRYITNEGRQWFVDAGKILHDSLKLSKPIDYKITVNACLTVLKNNDVDNAGKCLFDLLQKCQYCMKNKCIHKLRILENDSLVYEFHIFKRDAKHLNEQYVEIEISPFSIEARSPSVLELSTQSLVS